MCGRSLEARPRLDVAFLGNRTRQAGRVRAPHPRTQRETLPDARRGLFDQLLVYNLDRLGRKTRLIVNAVAELEKQVFPLVKKMVWETGLELATSSLGIW